MCLDDHTGEPLVRLDGLGRLGNGGNVREFELNSGAMGQNKFFVLQTPGMMQIDLLQVMRREHKLDSYSLNAVSARFLGDAKIDLPAAQIFAKFRGSAEDRAEIARYAAKDTLLPLQLLWKLSIFENFAEMANAVTVPLDYLMTRGQQIKVFSLVLKKARELGFVCPDNERIAVDGKYSGATVLDAQRGAYFDIVSGLDFASLYPSIMRARNLCYTTLVLDPKYDTVPGVEYYTVDTEQGTFRFAQGVPSVLPSLLEELAVFRKKAKRNMADAKARGDAFAASVFNGAQLAYKISMNSMYGFCGASKGFLPCVPIAASVTATGRAMIETTKRLAEELVPGSKVVYGDTDSVMVIFNVGEDKRHDMRAHFEVAERVANDISKTFKYPIELEFEKCYYPYLLFSKKRYAGLMYTKPDAPDYIDAKGLQLVRRDNCPLVKDVSEKILDAIMHDKSADAAIDRARDLVSRLLRNEFALDRFVVSKTLRGGYKNAAQPHVFVADKIRKRRGFPVNHGERVPYVFVRNDANPDCLLSEKAEDPAFVAENGLPLDVLYYIDHQLRSPIVSLLEVIVPDVDAAVFDHESIKPAMDELRGSHQKAVKTAKRLRKNATNRQHEITSFFSKIT